MEFRWCRFEDFSAGELYSALALRQDILVVEQSSPYRDLDFVDQSADHLLASEGAALAGYARSHAPSAGKPCASFGRVVVARQHRGKGLGRELVTRVLARLAQGRCPDILIGAQLYLEEFYSSFGFARDGESYDSEGVMHVDMRLRLQIRDPDDRQA
jgi:ElaA protein